MFEESRRAWRKPPSFRKCTDVADPRSPAALCAGLSWSNCGLCRDRGILRTSMTRSIRCARRRSRKTFHVRAECPTVKDSGGTHVLNQIPASWLKYWIILSPAALTLANGRGVLINSIARMYPA